MPPTPGDERTFPEPSEAWLRRMAAAESDCPLVAVGGLAAELGIVRYPLEPMMFREAVGRILEIARRAAGLSHVQLAARTGLSAQEIVTIERATSTAPEIVAMIAKTLALPSDKLASLASPTPDMDPQWVQAVTDFHQQTAVPSPLSDAERIAFSRLMEVIAK